MKNLKDWIILVVDDDPKGLHIMETLLNYYDATVLTGTNGQEGLEALRNNQVDLVISDLSMPVMDGWEMIEKIKHERRFASIPVIALTAHAMNGDRARAIAAGCHNYLTKPINPQTFLDNLIVILEEIPELAHRF